MRRTRATDGGVNFGCVVWLAVVALIAYGLYKVVPVKIASSTFYDAMQEQASFGSIKGQKQIEYDLLMKAKELDLPITHENLIIKRAREVITIEAHYEVEIDFFNGAYKYVWKFDPVVSRPIFVV